MRRNLLLLLAAAALCSPLANAQNLVVNGDFETPPFSIPTLEAISGWTLNGNVGSVDVQGSTSPTHAAALSLGTSFDGNSMSQTFQTLAGQVYTLTFDSGVYGIPEEGALQLKIEVLGTGNSNLLTDTVTPPSNGQFIPATFAAFNYLFTADGTSTTLRFSDVGGANANADVMVDTVVVAAVPEPGTYALLILGAGSLGYALRRRQVGA
jgi:hypothetical protein